MHLLDGVVTEPAMGLAFNAAGALGVAWALKRSRSIREAPPLAWAGTLGAFVLAAQAINVPVLGLGVSAHVIGSGLVTLVLGPALGVLVLSCVVLVQALFGDGGYTVLGVNWLNIAVLPTLAMHATAALFGRERRFSAVAGTVLGNVLSALSLSTLLVLGAGASFALVVPLLVGVQAIAGLAEGLITAEAVRRLFAAAPGLLEAGARPGGADAAPGRPALRWTALALGLLIALVPLASESPDALERVVQGLEPATAGEPADPGRPSAP